LKPLPRSRFVADPFALTIEDRLIIMLEKFDWWSNKGVISVLEMRDGKESLILDDVFCLPCHMSYPYLFKHEGIIYCVPESSGRVTLFRALDFPYNWEVVWTLTDDFPAVDPTLFWYGGYWWLFCGKQDPYAPNKLYAWYSENINGPWRPHLSNPLKTDVRSARPAGTPFVYKGVLYRPGQNCSVSYGGSIIINRVVRLTPKEFKEIPVRNIEPYENSPYPDGLHTLCGIENITILDGKRTIFIFPAFLTAVRELLKRIYSR
jgi:hypothetical protein